MLNTFCKNILHSLNAKLTEPAAQPAPAPPPDLYRQQRGRGGARLDELIVAVEQWALDRQIIPNSTPQAQLLKTVSELGELADATLKRDPAAISDGVGDVLVTLIIYARLQGVALVDCLEWAYDEIKDRKGTLTPEGVFVKECQPIVNDQENEGVLSG
jgi:NTP pyrophosphatase (non-canonical NTP hydrolase)